MEKALTKREKAFELQAIKLEEANITLKVLLNQREEDQADFEDRIIRNVRDLILPYVERLKTGRLNPKQATYLDIMASHLNEIISPFAQKLSSPHYNLTFREMQVADLVKEGKSSKEIGELLNLSTRTVKFHRENLRKKLGLKHKKQNLAAHLGSLK